MGAKLIRFNMYIVRISEEHQQKINLGVNTSGLQKVFQDSFPEIGFETEGTMPPMVIVPTDLDSPELIEQIQMTIDNWFAVQ